MGKRYKAIIFEQVEDGKGGFHLRPVTTTSTGLSVDLAAPILHVSRNTVYRLCEIGAIRAEYPSPGRIVIPLEELMRYKAQTLDPEHFEQQMDFDFEPKGKPT